MGAWPDCGGAGNGAAGLVHREEVRGHEVEEFRGQEGDKVDSVRLKRDPAAGATDAEYFGVVVGCGAKAGVEDVFALLGDTGVGDERVEVGQVG